MSNRSGDIVRWWGPPSVALGAGMWGLESLFRVRLQEHFPASLLVFYEHVLGTLLLAPLLWVYRRQLKQLTKTAIGWLLVSGVVGSAFGTVFFTASLKYLNVSVATVLLNLQPLVAVTMAAFLLREKLAPGFAKWAALAILAGIAITFEQLESFKVENPTGLLCVFGAIFCWGTATVAGRGMMRETSIVIAAPLRFAVGMLASLFVVLISGDGGLLAEKAALLGENHILKQYALLLLVAGITPTFFYFYGLKFTRATAGAFCEMIQAIVAVLMAWIVLGDALALHQMIAAAMLLLSITMINLLQAGKKS